MILRLNGRMMRKERKFLENIEIWLFISLVNSDFKPILAVVRTLSFGQKNKIEVDNIIDKLGAVSNLREKVWRW
jgi:hypothetical protein